ncbi:hypothetical protein PVAP13_1KG120100 [Panicum virgatum]|uniref:Uncharacterized protein n=1 Tax=Panicum virgatum TaxID=38727 RepID=A0A8T0XGE4_PANVG|nr:hypothetical protein PVAP13_1KG120100 [Panicum virgatum]
MALALPRTQQREGGNGAAGGRGEGCQLARGEEGWRRPTFPRIPGRAGIQQKEWTCRGVELNRSPRRVSALVSPASFVACTAPARGCPAARQSFHQGVGCSTWTGRRRNLRGSKITK